MEQKQYEWSDPPVLTAFPIAKAGYPMIFAAAFITLVFALLELTIPSILLLAVTFCLCWIFRDPDRIIPRGDNIVISPADGKVISVSRLNESDYYGSACMKISIFMRLYDVHVNRISHEGTITDTIYRPGKFVNASRDDAVTGNEQNALFIETDTGKKICIVQIAGLIARRIICGVQKGDQVKRGQRFGIICLGSRLDVYLPPDVTVNVEKGQLVRSGTTVLGYLA